ncbi:MAG TPA: hypothetical protein EYN73_02280 [Chromatiaceae bacterium]|jgi:phenylpyruvate tautomerase PptA (4-oxalocrotonate tautomerase family)|nr:hypothetical protein [Chromatiaceae bacterium]HIB84951.1 hypothetical protein [Chromatiaceae bacterium]HIN82977.1 hypothetical protein [Chromatiales bacterium]HIO15106.1 hypothetical protein [Chromatiales bacterium]
MPLLSIQSNHEINASERDAAIGELSSQIASMLGKPESYVMVNIQHNPAMSFGGSRDPLVYIELKSLGMDENRTTEFSATLCGLVNEIFSIPADRVYIEFSSGPRHMWGWNGTTF